jgi:hypothetical protein
MDIVGLKSELPLLIPIIMANNPKPTLIRHPFLTFAIWTTPLCLNISFLTSIPLTPFFNPSYTSTHGCSYLLNLWTRKRLSIITDDRFAIAMVVYLFSGTHRSLWDCGEFVLGEWTQVVHPPHLLPPGWKIVRLLSGYDQRQSGNIAFAVNLMFGACTALAAAFVAWTTMTSARLTMVGRYSNDEGTNLVTCGAGLAAGLPLLYQYQYGSAL